MTRAIVLPSMLLLFAIAVPVTGAAHSLPPPASLAMDPGQPGDPDGWHLLIGQAFVDTVTSNAADAILASNAALQNDHWELKPEGTDTHLLSEWKPIHHVLFRLFTGRAFGRILVDVTPVSATLCQLRFQGVLATSRDLEHNPARGWAEQAYAHAAHSWQAEVRDDIEHGIPTGNGDRHSRRVKEAG